MSNYSPVVGVGGGGGGVPPSSIVSSQLPVSNQNPGLNQPQPPQTHPQPPQTQSQPPATSTRVSVNPWIKQTIERLHSLFFSHTNVPMISSENMYINLLEQFSQNPNVNQLTISNYFMAISLWGLVRVNACEDTEARRQFALFMNHLQDAENALNKSIQIHQKIQNSVVPVPSSQRVQSLPLTVQHTTNI